MSGPHNEDSTSRRRNRHSSSRSSRASGHAPAYGPDRLTGFHSQSETPRFDNTPQLQEPYGRARPQSVNLNPPYYIPVPGNPGSTYGRGPPSNYDYPQGHYSTGDHRHSVPFRAQGVNERYRPEEQYDDEEQLGEYEYDQGFEHGEHFERGPQHEHNERDVFDENGEYDEDYEDGEMAESSIADYQQPASHHRIHTQPGHPYRVSTQGALDPRYVVQYPAYFGPGKVFSILWHENDGRDSNGTHVSAGPLFRGKYGEAIYSTIRRMVVFKAFEQYSWCFSISTYGGRGLAKPGIDASKHTIAFMSGTAPRVGSNEPLMVKEPLAVDPERFDESLHSKSRLNFGKIYTVEHNVKVLPIGVIAEVSMPKFISYARAELAI